ncbi:MAG: hypothetical protein EOO05_16560 [Chitinophagaceae bacterium]|nr:MAG: hypothetical protein EOO05_16560 [Chitinophagaceae bacterium]
MKRSILNAVKSAILSVVFLSWSAVAFAQDKIVIDKSEAESWLMRNWIWVALGALVLLILLFSGSRARRRTTTTVTKDDYGNVRKVTTTEIDD